MSLRAKRSSYPTVKRAMTTCSFVTASPSRIDWSLWRKCHLQASSSFLRSGIHKRTCPRGKTDSLYGEEDILLTNEYAQEVRPIRCMERRRFTHELAQEVRPIRFRVVPSKDWLEEDSRGAGERKRRNEDNESCSNLVFLNARRWRVG